MKQCMLCSRVTVAFGGPLLRYSQFAPSKDCRAYTTYVVSSLLSAARHPGPIDI